MGRRLGFSLLAVFISSNLETSAISAAPQDQEDDWEEEESLPVEIHGFAETAFAARVIEDPAQPDDFLLTEARFRLDLSHFSDQADLTFKGDFVADSVTGDVEIDLRQVTITLRARDWLDIRAGRQVLTWGTGDLLFLNDLFPKDFVSFFIGRDDEFLKAPSSSLKFTFYSSPANLDVVWTPVFTPDRFITGERLSFFDPSTPGLVSAETMGEPLPTSLPQKTIENGELATRLFRNVGSYEIAFYGYVGFLKQPRAFDPETELAIHPRLAVYGGSARGSLLGGVTHVEVAYYDSLDESDGEDPDIPNSEFRGLVGHERELFRNFTAGFQYYLEWKRHYDRLIASSTSPQFEPSELRHLITTRLTYRLAQDTLTLTLFVFAAPGDGDGHLRPTLTYKWSDAVTIAAGANVMFGDDPTFFGQLENNSNAYFRVRYSF